MANARKIVDTFCERQVTPKRRFDRRSFRYKKSGKAWVLVGCPRGKWSARKETCRVGTRAYKVLVPARGKRCKVGEKKIKKARRA